LKSFHKMRLEIAHAAARLLAVDGGLNDFLSAKKKAALQLGFNPDGNLPTNQEVESALMVYQRLCRADTHADNLTKLHRIALSAMVFLAEFNPCLVGPVLSGTATQHCEIVLHVFSDDIGSIGLLFDKYAVPFQGSSKTVRYDLDEHKDYPAIYFLAEEQKVAVVVFPLKRKNHALSAIKNKPMQRAFIGDAKKLLGHSENFHAVNPSVL